MPKAARCPYTCTLDILVVLRSTASGVVVPEERHRCTLLLLLLLWSLPLWWVGVAVHNKLARVAALAPASHSRFCAKGSNHVGKELGLTCWLCAGRITVIIKVGIVDPLGIGNPNRGKLRISTLILAFIALGASAFEKLFRFKITITLTFYVRVEFWAFTWSTIWSWEKSITLFVFEFEPEPFLQLADIKPDGTLYVMVGRAKYFAGNWPSVTVTVAHVKGEVSPSPPRVKLLVSHHFRFLHVPCRCCAPVCPARADFHFAASPWLAGFLPFHRPAPKAFPLVWRQAGTLPRAQAAKPLRVPRRLSRWVHPFETADRLAVAHRAV